ncbi:uncharacterized protein MYCFIDRAFT_173722 [Pseudocercospora fijiensis CIRAD86]|uniref:Uncharacterized protein n=1 Tax=Pseudocercospora fijiensis (strain CIRAD86) TaxID=383855 RepID=M3B603_PSEFD|nr:uncharacterized protein MYCFIDRAFT_173722 [Pseudocercospora fijiensis CIRAD86]EME84797.1 hypothetical protein MYCFIDRAFT_173722 [Pseudocercospora fijiensis CIRAD86]
MDSKTVRHDEMGRFLQRMHDASLFVIVTFGKELVSGQEVLWSAVADSSSVFVPASWIAVCLNYAKYPVLIRAELRFPKTRTPW